MGTCDQGVRVAPFPVARLLDGAGQGIPVVRDANGVRRGVEGVIDKDLSSAHMAQVLGIRDFMILTSVERVQIGFGTPRARSLDGEADKMQWSLLRSRWTVMGGTAPRGFIESAASALGRIHEAAPCSEPCVMSIRPTRAFEPRADTRRGRGLAEAAHGVSHNQRIGTA